MESQTWDSRLKRKISRMMSNEMNKETIALDPKETEKQKKETEKQTKRTDIQQKDTKSNDSSHKSTYEENEKDDNTIDLTKKESIKQEEQATDNDQPVEVDGKFIDRHHNYQARQYNLHHTSKNLYSLASNKQVGPLSSAFNLVGGRGATFPTNYTPPLGTLGGAGFPPQQNPPMMAATNGTQAMQVPHNPIQTMPHDPAIAPGFSYGEPILGGVKRTSPLETVYKTFAATGSIASLVKAHELEKARQQLHQQPPQQATYSIQRDITPSMPPGLQAGLDSQDLPTMPRLSGTRAAPLYPRSIINPNTGGLDPSPAGSRELVVTIPQEAKNERIKRFNKELEESNLRYKKEVKRQRRDDMLNTYQKSDYDDEPGYHSSDIPGSPMAGSAQISSQNGVDEDPSDYRYDR